MLQPSQHHRGENAHSKQEMETDPEDRTGMCCFSPPHLPIGLKNIPIPRLESLSFWQFVMSNKFAG